ncbi:MAG TPA: lysylphosphatidylglycerol synthase transmembrane domain-containing protein [Natronosporangium sp.]
MADGATAVEPGPEGDIPVAEPAPRRPRRPIDGVRMLLYGGATALVVLGAVFAEGSFRGLATDLAQLGEQVPAALVDVVGFAAELAAWALPLALVGILIWRRWVRTIVELLAAGLAAAAITVGASIWLETYAPEQVERAFAPLVADPERAPIPALPALVVAVVTVATRLKSRRVFQVALLAVAGTFTVGLLRGEASVAGTLVALGTGRVIGLAARLIGGEQLVVPRAADIVRALVEHGHRVRRVVADPVADYRRYVVETDDGPLGVLVLNREIEGAGLLSRLVDRLRTREEILPRQAVTMRTITDRLTLIGLALEWAGARVPRLRQVIRLDAETTLLVQDHIRGRPLRELAADGKSDELTDEMLTDLWQQLDRMRAHQVAHRRLGPSTILAGDDGHIWLLNPSGGEVAAPDVALGTDLAQALVTTALVAGPDRVAASAVRTLGAETVSRAVPLLQALVLTRGTRRTLREHRDLLAALRDRIGSEVGGPPATPVRVRRFRLLSLVTGVATVVAVYLVATQLSEVPIGEVVGQADWRWVAVAVVAMAVNYIGAAYAVLGFVPEPVPFRHALAAQVTLGFVRVVAPVAVSGAAINLRLLTKAGVPGPAAAASVAAYQLGAVVVTVPLIAVLGVVSGLGVSGLSPSPTVLAATTGAILAGGLVTLIPPIRRRIRKFWDDFARRGMSRLLDVLSRPRKLAEAVGGVLLQTLALVVCFYASIRAVGGRSDFAGLAVVQMVGQTVGSAAPTPGGLGAVEAALSAGVTALGSPAAVAVPGVLLFRIISFWLPMLPAWLLWTQLQRREIL